MSDLLTRTWGALGPALQRAGNRDVLARWLEAAERRCVDAAFAARFKAACPVDGVDARAYNHVWLDVESHRALVGVRFKGGDLAQPFVELVAVDGDIDGESGWRATVAAVAVHFEAFSPLWLRLRWPGEAPPPIDAPLEIDQHLVAERLDALVARPPLPCTSLTFTPAVDTAWFPAFEAAFGAWRAANPALGAEVSPADREVLDSALERGAVVCAWRDGVWMGVIAATRQDERALSGFVVLESFLDAPARGLGCAAPMQRALIDLLAGEYPRDALWGTIHGSNLPSLRTAARCGRAVVETWWFAAITNAYGSDSQT